MSSYATKYISPFPYIGGKYRMLPELYSHFPDHKYFAEVMGGSMVVSLNKRNSEIDTVNDIDDEIINFFKVLRENPAELIGKLKLTPVARNEFFAARRNKNPDPLERARSFYIRARMSFQANGQTSNGSFNCCITESRNGMSINVNGWINAIEKLPELVDRLRRLQIENLPYQKFIAKYDHPDTFFYVDPPYELKERNRKYYKNEFTQADQEELAALLNNVKGKVMVSGYLSDVYTELYKGWNVIPLKSINNAAKRGMQNEYIYTNYSSRQLNIFNQINPNL